MIAANLRRSAISLMIEGEVSVGAAMGRPYNREGFLPGRCIQHRSHVGNHRAPRSRGLNCGAFRDGLEQLADYFHY